MNRRQRMMWGTGLFGMGVVIAACGGRPTAARPTPPSPRSFSRASAHSSGTGALAHAPGASSARPSGGPTPPQAPLALVSLTMVTPQLGWALTQGGVYRTQDGGRRWDNVTPKGYPGLPGAGPLDARGAYPGAQFPSSQEAVVAVPQTQGSSTVVVWATQNGGSSWFRVNLPHAGTPVLALSMPDPRHGWLETLLGGAAGSEAVRIYQTQDAGKTWTLVGGAGLNRAGPGTLPFGGDKIGLAFGSPAHGVAVGEQAAPGAWVYDTQDGGRTWQPAVVPPASGAPSLVTCAIPQFFGPAQAVMAAYLTPVSGGTPHTVVYRTTDGGAHWMPGAALPGRATAVDFISPTVGWALDGQLYHTVNGGVTWTAVPTNVQPGGSLDFVSATMGWRYPAVGEPGGFQTTENGGQTWQPWAPYGITP
ncbi:MAG: hypothetical protein K6U14_00755 [Firmicutes bacterium]|nr:hypothetical protein [Alicyclobacillaceae bacterium]MCL6496148.1 hypothetical protein [Bacillota bacterium]